MPPALSASNVPFICLPATPSFLPFLALSSLSKPFRHTADIFTFRLWECSIFVSSKPRRGSKYVLACLRNTTCAQLSNHALDFRSQKDDMATVYSSVCTALNSFHGVSVAFTGYGNLSSVWHRFRCGCHFFHLQQ